MILELLQNEIAVISGGTDDKEQQPEQTQATILSVDNNAPKEMGWKETVWRYCEIGTISTLLVTGLVKAGIGIYSWALAKKATKLKGQ